MKLKKKPSFCLFEGTNSIPKYPLSPDACTHRVKFLGPVSPACSMFKRNKIYNIHHNRNIYIKVGQLDKRYLLSSEVSNQERSFEKLFSV
jgi:hypothetical protein